MVELTLSLLALISIGLIEVPRLRREGRWAELRAFWVLFGLGLPLAIWAALGTVPPLNQGIAALLRPLGQWLTGPLQ